MAAGSGGPKRTESKPLLSVAGRQTEGLSGFISWVEEDCGREPINISFKKLFKFNIITNRKAGVKKLWVTVTRK